MVLLETRQGKYEELFFGGKKIFFCKTKKVDYLSGYIMYYISPPSNISPSPPLKFKGSFQTYYHLIPWGLDTVSNPLCRIKFMWCFNIHFISMIMTQIVAVFLPCSVWNDRISEGKFALMIYLDEYSLFFSRWVLLIDKTLNWIQKLIFLHSHIKPWLSQVLKSLFSQFSLVSHQSLRSESN